MLVIIVVHMSHSQEGLSWFPYLKLIWHLLERVLEEGFWVRSSSAPLGSVITAHGVFSNRDLPSTSGGQPIAIAYSILGVCWTTLTNGLITDFSCLVRLLLDSLWFWQGALSIQMGKFHLKYAYICIQKLKCIIDIFRETVNNTISDFFRHIYHYFTLLSPSLFNSLPSS